MRSGGSRLRVGAPGRGPVTIRPTGQRAVEREEVAVRRVERLPRKLMQRRISPDVDVDRPRVRRLDLQRGGECVLRLWRLERLEERLTRAADGVRMVRERPQGRELRGVQLARERVAAGDSGWFPELDEDRRRCPARRIAAHLGKLHDDSVHDFDGSFPDASDVGLDVLVEDGGDSLECRDRFRIVRRERVGEPVGLERLERTGSGRDPGRRLLARQHLLRRVGKERRRPVGAEQRRGRLFGILDRRRVAPGRQRRQRCVRYVVRVDHPDCGLQLFHVAVEAGVVNERHAGTCERRAVGEIAQAGQREVVGRPGERERPRADATHEFAELRDTDEARPAGVGVHDRRARQCQRALVTGEVAVPDEVHDVRRDALHRTLHPEKPGVRDLVRGLLEPAAAPRQRERGSLVGIVDGDVRVVPDAGAALSRDGHVSEDVDGDAILERAGPAPCGLPDQLAGRERRLRTRLARAQQHAEVVSGGLRAQREVRQSPERAADDRRKQALPGHEVQIPARERQLEPQRRRIRGQGARSLRSPWRVREAAGTAAPAGPAPR